MVLFLDVVPKKHICFTDWCNFQLWLLEVGEQRVKLDGRAAREPFGGNALVINICYEEIITILEVLFGREI